MRDNFIAFGTNRSADCLLVEPMAREGVSQHGFANGYDLGETDRLGSQAFCLRYGYFTLGVLRNFHRGTAVRFPFFDSAAHPPPLPGPEGSFVRSIAPHPMRPGYIVCGLSDNGLAIEFIERNASGPIALPRYQLLRELQFLNEVDVAATRVGDYILSALLRLQPDVAVSCPNLTRALALSKQVI